MPKNLRLVPMVVTAALAPVALAPVALARSSVAAAAAMPTLGPRLPDVKANSRGLTITLSAVPARAAAGATVQFNLSLAARAANGALGYMVKFGDGSSHANAIPMYCLAGPGRPEHQTWRLTHRYAHAGTYHVSAVGYANCGPDHTSVTSLVTIS